MLVVRACRLALQASAAMASACCSWCHILTCMPALCPQPQPHLLRIMLPT
jgi:hypothetical protein